ncbi:MAG: thioredoxin [Rhodothermia bacterium]|nr:thioredoxin [Rhodothermia bacterium]
MAFEVQNFQEDVLDKSREIPVVVDFWAPWCGPCRILGPVLEELAADNGEAWKLVKVNTDENQELSIQYGIRGIPAVKMFVDGEVVDEFTGALPKHAVEQWLSRAVPSKSQNLVDEARQAIEEGRNDSAKKLLETALSEDAGNTAAALMLAQHVLFDEPERARQLVESVEIVDPVLQQVGGGIVVISRLLAMNPPFDNLPGGTGKGSYIRAIEALTQEQVAQALEAFIEVISTDRYYDDDGARKACLALFSMLGEQHPVTREYRPQFNMALY